MLLTFKVKSVVNFQGQELSTFKVTMHSGIRKNKLKVVGVCVFCFVLLLSMFFSGGF